MVKEVHLLDDDTTLVLSFDVQTVSLLEVFDVISQSVQGDTLLRCIHKASTSLPKNVTINENPLKTRTRRTTYC